MRECRKIFINFFLLYFSFFLVAPSVFAEDLPAGRVIPKLPKTADDPVLLNGKVYPFWGPPCQRYTYSVIYADRQGRPPEYIKIYFNGKMLDMDKEDAAAGDYQKGVKYIFQNIPRKYGSNFYFFEASNGLGKARASIIDSPDNGPVLFDADFKENEIVLIDSIAGRELWRYPIGEEWVGGVALSNDGRYLAAQSSNHVYFFDTAKTEPLWIYTSPTRANIGGDVKGGVAISADGSKVFAALSGRAVFFDSQNPKPLWSYNLEQNGGSAYGVDLAPTGSHAAVAMAGSESDLNSNVLILLDQNGKKLWQYHSSGNWHEVSFSQNGLYLAGSTGCPDRRGYLFSLESPEPVIKSEPLSKESPVDEARISADGGLVAFGAESGYGAIILMTKDSRQVLWKYETPQRKSVRALAMTPDGKTIGAGTFGGDILLFGKTAPLPVEKLKINSAIGAFDLSADGSVFVTGSADKKVRVFHRGEGRAKAEIELGEYVGEVDLSADGRVAAAGTSGAVYFFETLPDLNNAPVFNCTEIIEPPPEDEGLFGGQNSGWELMDDNVKNDPENDEKSEKSSFSLRVISASAAILFSVILAVYVFLSRKKGMKCKKIILIPLALAVFLSLAALAFSFWRDRKEVITQDKIQKQTPVSAEKGVCGNSLCEPDLGETSSNCRDCHPSD